MKLKRAILLPLLLLLAFVLSSWASSANSYQASKPWLDTAKSYKGTVEKPKGSNRGYYIDKWNKFVGNALGSPYCAAFVGYCKYYGNASWLYKTGLAQNYFLKAPKATRHTALEVVNGRYRPVAGDLVIWGRGNTINGHVGFVLYDWTGRGGWTIEANTSPTDAGSQANGDGVYVKYRKIYLFQYFRIIGFVHLEVG